MDKSALTVAIKRSFDVGLSVGPYLGQKKTPCKNKGFSIIMAERGGEAVQNIKPKSIRDLRPACLHATAFFVPRICTSLKYKGFLWFEIL
ncbi:MAG: hypothetical protein COB46_07630 [Rhodospirillaceae bacterium]|nr:MAG: hypothetical protein COB46_07630 [Rhodospirillaceae bacterium]